MKVIHLLYRATVGGTERTVYNLINEQLNNNYDVYCIVLENGGGFIQKYKSLLNENLIIVNIKTFQGILDLFKLLKIFSKEWIIHNHVRNLKLGLILKLLNKKKILTEHVLTDKFKEINPQAYRKLKIFYFFYSKDYTYITAVSGAVKKCLVNDFGVDPERIRVIFNAVKRCQAFVVDFNGYFIVGNATHFEKIKNIDFFISIAERLIAKNENFKFLLIGDGSQKSRIQEKIIKKGLEKNILLWDSQEDLNPFFKQLNLGLVTSFSETFSMFAAECLTRGIPMVASAVGGLKEVVKDNKCGYLIDVFDEDIFIEKILKLKNDENLYRKFSENARKQGERFSVDNIFKDYHALYQEIMS